MTYAVKEIFYTLQGEGIRAGRPAVFCRFAGCNLWSGREQDREQAVCKFCDTDFVGTNGTDGGKYDSAAVLANKVNSFWPVDRPGKYVVLTGGEPLLQLDSALIDGLHSVGFEIAVETNGTIPVLKGVDWICVSPKEGAPLLQKSGDELKVVIPQINQNLHALVELDFHYHLLQPMDGPLRRRNTEIAIEACMSDPRWRLSIQTHKYLSIR
jgi:7-carboxy-7-deazaguanine synthase